MNNKEKKDLLKKYDLEVLLLIIYELGEHILSTTDSKDKLPSHTVHALTIASDVIDDSNIEERLTNHYTSSDFFTTKIGLA